MSQNAIKVGLIGLGLMGRGIGRNLVAKGFPLAVLGHRNRAPVEDLVSRGAMEMPDAASLARSCDVLLLCVTGSTEVEDLVLRPEGILAGSHPGLTVIDASTSEPASTLRLAAMLRQAGARLVDAPLTRTPREAEAGQLNTLVGASVETLADIRPVLEAYCENIFHAGALGSGHRLKLISNFLVTGTVALAAEAIVLARKTDIDLTCLNAVIEAGPLANTVLRNLVPKAAEGQFDGLSFGLANARKDLRYFTHFSEEAGVASPMAAMAYQMFTQAVAQGFGDRLLASLIEEQAKVNRVTL
jgi:3-hydroxyisobutyrate dehydrogenase-like beta-hydroxyacid dehydrogenase